jgi:hypothetical protein
MNYKLNNIIIPIVSNYDYRRTISYLNYCLLQTPGSILFLQEVIDNVSLE